MLYIICYIIYLYYIICTGKMGVGRVASEAYSRPQQSGASSSATKLMAVPPRMSDSAACTPPPGQGIAPIADVGRVCWERI